MASAMISSHNVCASTSSKVIHRKITTSAQDKALEDIYKTDTKPNAALREKLAYELDMTPRGVQVWFQNRRAKENIKAGKHFGAATPDSVLISVNTVEPKRKTLLEEIRNQQREIEELMDRLKKSQTLTCNNSEKEDWQIKVVVPKTDSLLSTNSGIPPRTVTDNGGMKSNSTSVAHNAGVKSTQRLEVAGRNGCLLLCTGNLRSQTIGHTVDTTSLEDFLRPDLGQQRDSPVVSSDAVCYNIRSYLSENPRANRLSLLLAFASGIQTHHKNGSIVGSMSMDNFFVDQGCLLCFVFCNPSENPSQDTWRYAAPELITETQSVPTKASDIYGLAMVAYKILTGSQPYSETEKLAEVLEWIGSGVKPRVPSALAHSSVEGFLRSEKNWEFLYRCWNVDPLARPSIEDVVTFFNQALGYVDGEEIHTARL